MTDGFIGTSEEGTLLTLRVSPDARRFSLEGAYGKGALQIKIAAPPVDGKANEELRHFLAKSLSVSRARVELVHGATGRDKTVRLHGVEPQDILSALFSDTSR